MTEKIINALNNDELDKVKVCLGTRYTSPYYESLNGLCPNKNGKTIDAERCTMRDVLYYIANGDFKRKAEIQHEKQPQFEPKYFAHSLYPSEDHRYTIYEDIKHEDGTKYKITTNLAYTKFNGFQGIDIDSDHSHYTKEQRVEIGNVLKQICYEKLCKYDWFIGVTLSTGGNGTHVWTASKINKYVDDIEDIITLYHLNFQCKSFAVFECLVELANRLNYVDLEYTQIDTAMDKPTQTLNITVCDTEPFINPNFVFDYDDVVNEIFTHNENKHKIIVDDESVFLMNDTQKRIYDEYNKWYEKEYEKKLKKYETTTQDNNFVYDGIDIETCDFDLEKSKGPFYFRHKSNEDKFWSGNQIINTLLFFYDKETVKQIWRHPKFYDKDPSDWLRFVDSWHQFDNAKPNIRLIEWLNENCGFNITYKTKTHERTIEEKYDHVIRLNDDEFLGDKYDELFSYFKVGINLLISGVGTGKTTIWKQRDKMLSDDVMNCAMMKTTIITEPYNAVLNNKFGDTNIPIFKESHHFWSESLPVGLCASNYKKLIELDPNKDIEWNKIDYIVCDESHLLTKESYRSDDLLKMIVFLKEAAQHIPVVLMTGTPIDEINVFDDVNTIKVVKTDKRKIFYKNVRFRPNEKMKYFDISSLLTLIQYLRKEKRKVYIYDSNISLRKCRKLADLLPNMKVCIYHKRNIDSISDNGDMIYIDTNHELADKFDVIISSCYFGVGNDLNDDCKTSCIIIGNHTWQEDIQVIGRWRNSKDIKVFNILMPNDENNTHKLNKEKLLQHQTKLLNVQYSDATVRDKSIVIGSNEITVNNDADIPVLALMKMCDLYNSSLEYKREMLTENYVECDINQIKPLSWSECDFEASKKLNKEYKDKDRKIKSETLFALHNDEEITWHNDDARIVSWQRDMKYIHDNHIVLFSELIKTDWCMYTKNNDALHLCVRLLKNMNEGMIDYAEMRMMSWVRVCANNDDVEQRVIDVCDKSGITTIDYYIVCAYVYMIYNANTNEDAQFKRVDGDYLFRFRRYCYMFINMNDAIYDYLFDVIGVDKSSLFPMIEFESRISHVEDIRISKNETMYVFNECVRKIKDYRIANVVNSSTKQCVVTDKMPEKLLTKYNLKTGQEFGSLTDLRDYTKITKMTQSRWLKSQYLSVL